MILGEVEVTSMLLTQKHFKIILCDGNIHVIIDTSLWILTKS